MPPSNVSSSNESGSNESGSNESSSNESSSNESSSNESNSSRTMAAAVQLRRSSARSLVLLQVLPLPMPGVVITLSHLRRKIHLRSLHNLRSPLSLVSLHNSHRANELTNKRRPRGPRPRQHRHCPSEPSRQAAHTPRRSNRIPPVQA